MKSWKLKIVAEYKQELAHEGPVFNAKTNTLFFTSNRLYKKDGSQYVVISRYDPSTGTTTDLELSNRIPMKSPSQCKAIYQSQQASLSSTIKQTKAGF